MNGAEGETSLKRQRGEAAEKEKEEERRSRQQRETEEEEEEEEEEEVSIIVAVPNSMKKSERPDLLGEDRKGGEDFADLIHAKQEIIKDEEDDLGHENPTPTAKKPFVCSYPGCGARFTNARNRQRHENLHTGAKTHECKTCRATFARGSDLTAHERKHSGEKPYRCGLCAKAFTRNCDLRAHEHKHTMADLKCEHCPLRFILARDLRAHIKSDHVALLSQLRVDSPVPTNTIVSSFVPDTFSYPLQPSIPQPVHPQHPFYSNPNITAFVMSEFPYPAYVQHQLSDPHPQNTVSPPPLMSYHPPSSLDFVQSPLTPVHALPQNPPTVIPQHSAYHVNYHSPSLHQPQIQPQPQPQLVPQFGGSFANVRPISVITIPLSSLPVSQNMAPQNVCVTSASQNSQFAHSDIFGAQNITSNSSMPSALDSNILLEPSLVHSHPFTPASIPPPIFSQPLQYAADFLHASHFGSSPSQSLPPPPQPPLNEILPPSNLACPELTSLKLAPIVAAGPDLASTNALANVNDLPGVSVLLNGPLGELPDADLLKPLLSNRASPSIPSFSESSRPSTIQLPGASDIIGVQSEPPGDKSLSVIPLRQDLSTHSSFAGKGDTGLPPPFPPQSTTFPIPQSLPLNVESQLFQQSLPLTQSQPALDSLSLNAPQINTDDTLISNVSMVNVVPIPSPMGSGPVLEPSSLPVSMNTHVLPDISFSTPLDPPFGSSSVPSSYPAMHIAQPDHIIPSTSSPLALPIPPLSTMFSQAPCQGTEKQPQSINLTINNITPQPPAQGVLIQTVPQGLLMQSVPLGVASDQRHGGLSTDSNFAPPTFSVSSSSSSLSHLHQEPSQVIIRLQAPHSSPSLSQQAALQVNNVPGSSHSNLPHAQPYSSNFHGHQQQQYPQYSLSQQSDPFVSSRSILTHLHPPDHENHPPHSDPSHIHGAGCGHQVVVHQDHLDFVGSDGRLHHVNPKQGLVDIHYVDHLSIGTLPPSQLNVPQHHGCEAEHTCPAHFHHDSNHVHSSTCGHVSVRHLDHLDYIVDGVLHYEHNGHCDIHGMLQVLSNEPGTSSCLNDLVELFSQ